MESGFTLVELLVASLMFMVIGGATLSLFAKHQPIFNQQQNLAEVNIALRNGGRANAARYFQCRREFLHRSQHPQLSGGRGGE